MTDWNRPPVKRILTMKFSNSVYQIQSMISRGDGKIILQPVYHTFPFLGKPSTNYRVRETLSPEADYYGFYFDIGFEGVTQAETAFSVPHKDSPEYISLPELPSGDRSVAVSEKLLQFLLKFSEDGLRQIMR